MAIEHGWTGWESGETDSCIALPVRGGVVGVTTVYPRTGQFCMSVLAGQATANAWTAYRRKNAAIGGAGTPLATAIARVFFRINRDTDQDATGIFQAGTLSTTGQRGALLLNISRNFRAFAGNANGTLSTAVLSLGVWYRADLTHSVQDSGTSTIVTTTIDVSDEAGALVETVTRTSTMALTNPELPTDVAVGNGTATTATLDVDYDDLWWASADGADLASLIFPTAAMRVTRVPVLAQGSVAQWTGDVRTQLDFPMQTVTADEQSNGTITQQTLFTHATAASLGISGIEGVIVRARLRSVTSSGNESLMLGGVAYPVPVLTTFANQGQNGVNYATIAEATFDGWEFGARNDRGTGLRLGATYLEVLHGGSSIPAPYTDVAEPFRLNLITYTGNAGYQTVTGMGFGAQALMIKPTGSSLTEGGFKLARAGGTRMQGYQAAGLIYSNGVLSLTDDGFVLGPNNEVNRSGIVYLAIGIRDGGAGGGFYLSTRDRMGQFIDNFDVVFKEPFTPDLAFNHAAQTGGDPIMRTSAMVGDLSISMGGHSAVTNLIQALQATGFQVGSNSAVASQNLNHYGLIMRIGAALGLILHVGTMTPTGATATITGIPFTPVFVACVRQNTPPTGEGFWRTSLIHTALASSQWTNGNNVNTAITAITADGFTIGSSLSTNGIPVHWFAFAPGALSAGGCLVNMANGADSGGIAGCRVSLGT